MAASSDSITVGVPIHNEEANLQSLLECLCSQPDVAQILTVDDWSTDRSGEILQSFRERDPRIRIFRPPQRSGQLAAWIRMAREAGTKDIVYIDADALPAAGAIGTLCAALNDRAVIVSGRVIAANLTARFPAARFRASVLHRVRCLGFAKEAIIGRFFAVRRDWFLRNAGATEIIANDAYLGCLARQQGHEALYEPHAVCLYSEATITRDFAAQRQRADAGYAQLRELGIMSARDEPSKVHYAGAVGRELLADPIGGMSWIVQQMRSRFIRAYQPQGRDLGGWETQPTTKRSLR